MQMTVGSLRGFYSMKNFRLVFNHLVFWIASLSQQRQLQEETLIHYGAEHRPGPSSYLHEEIWALPAGQLC